MAGYNNYGYPNQMSGYTGNNMFGLSPQDIIKYFEQGRLQWNDFVHGRAGAEAYQLPPGVFRAKLWDDETNRFYVKGYDNDGRPRILDDNDFDTHIEPEPITQPQIDLSNYATKADIQAMIGEAFRNIRFPNMDGYVTQDYLNNRLSGLCVGSGGRIVSENE